MNNSKEIKRLQKEEDRLWEKFNSYNLPSEIRDVVTELIEVNIELESLCNV